MDRQLYEECERTYIENARRYLGGVNLLSYIHEYNSHNLNFDTPLNQAALNNNYEICKLLIENGADVNYRSSRLYTPLHAVCYYKRKEGDSTSSRYELAKLLIENGAEINVENFEGDTPLHLAASGGHYEIVKLLIESGASINKRNYSGDYYSGGTPLHSALALSHRTEDTWENKYNICKLLIENGADVNAKNDCDNTPLHEAASGGHYEICGLLMENGADINAKNEYNSTPICNSLRYSEEYFMFFVNNGADILVKDKGGDLIILSRAKLYNNMFVYNFVMEYETYKRRSELLLLSIDDTIDDTIE
jgi:ankyrin repeat protein